LPTTSKKQTAGRFVELNLSLKVPKKQYPMVEEALTAVLDLAGLKANSEKAEKPKPPSVAKPGRPPKAKPVRAKASPKKQAKPASGRRPAAEKKAPKTAVLIRDLRNKAGLSQKSLAEKLGVRQNVISLLETGRQKPNLDMAIKLGQILKTPFQDFQE